MNMQFIALIIIRARKKANAFFFLDRLCPETYEFVVFRSFWTCFEGFLVAYTYLFCTLVAYLPIHCLFWHFQGAFLPISPILAFFAYFGIFMELFLGNVLAQMKFFPITSCDVERSFSDYKSILTEKRTSFTPENLEMHVICYYESRNQQK